MATKLGGSAAKLGACAPGPGLKPPLIKNHLLTLSWQLQPMHLLSLKDLLKAKAQAYLVTNH